MKFNYFISSLLFLIAPLCLGQSLSKINIATYIEPPFAEVVDGKYVGRNIRVADLLGKSLNKEINFIYCPIARCLLMMESGKADMIISILKTPAREQYLSYISPPLTIQTLPIVFYTRYESQLTIENYEDLKPLIIGTIRGTGYFDRFDNDTRLAKAPITNREQLIQMLLKKRIDAFIGRAESIEPLLTEQTSTQIKKSRFEYKLPVPAYIAVSKASQLHYEVEEIASVLTSLIDSGDISKAISSHSTTKP